MKILNVNYVILTGTPGVSTAAATGSWITAVPGATFVAAPITGEVS